MDEEIFDEEMVDVKDKNDEEVESEEEIESEEEVDTDKEVDTDEEIESDQNEEEKEVKSDEKFVIKPFKLKDYAYQCRNQIHCAFKYLILIYDQMCDCGDEYGQEDQMVTCEGDFESLGYINYLPDQFTTLIEDVAFQFDSDSENSVSPIANQLLLILKDWCRKITRIRLNTTHIYTTRLNGYNVDLLDDLIKQIKLHKDIDREKFLNLKHLTVDIDVTFTDLYHEEIKEIGMNLCYCNYLIYDFIKEFYTSCGFFLGSNAVNPDNMPFYNGKQKISSAYCHLYLAPLNLKDYYFYRKDDDD